MAQGSAGCKRHGRARNEAIDAEYDQGGLPCIRFRMLAAGRYAGRGEPGRCRQAKPPSPGRRAAPGQREAGRVRHFSNLPTAMPSGTDRTSQFLRNRRGCRMFAPWAKGAVPARRPAFTEPIRIERVP